MQVRRNFFSLASLTPVVQDKNNMQMSLELVLCCIFNFFRWTLIELSLLSPVQFISFGTENNRLHTRIFGECCALCCKFYPAARKVERLKKSAASALFASPDAAKIFVFFGLGKCGTHLFQTPRQAQSPPCFNSRFTAERKFWAGPCRRYIIFFSVRF